jgi:hypothetical protein
MCRAIDTCRYTEAVLAEVIEIQKHLLAQDAWLQRLIQTQAGRAGPGPPPEPALDQPPPATSTQA